MELYTSNQVQNTTPSSQTSAPIETFRLLGLPAELRCIIYRQALVRPGEFVHVVGTTTLDGGWLPVEQRLWKRQRGHCRPVSEMAFLRSCRQIYEEGTAVFYAENEFALGSIQALYTFLKKIGEQRLNLRYTSIYGMTAARHLRNNAASASDFLAGMPALRRLEIFSHGMDQESVEKLLVALSSALIARLGAGATYKQVLDCFVVTPAEACDVHSGPWSTPRASCPHCKARVTSFRRGLSQWQTNALVTIMANLQRKARLATARAKK